MEYLAACFFMGFGVAIDVMVATLASYREFGSRKDAWIWASRNALTHTVFPVLGIAAAYGLEAAFPVLKMVIGIIAFVLVVKFLGEEIAGCAGYGSEDEEEPKGMGWAAVIAVSVDALMSGPAKAAQAEGWDLNALLWSFPIVGLVVGLHAFTAAEVAAFLKRRSERGTDVSPQNLARVEIGGLFIETAVIGYFGWLALDHGIGMNLPWYAVAGVSLAVTITTFTALGRRMWINNTTENTAPEEDREAAAG